MIEILIFINELKELQKLDKSKSFLKY